jgi:hypothetical protein
VLAAAGEYEAAALADVAYADADDLEAAYLLGAWHWWRYHLLPETDQDPDGRAAVAWFTRVFPSRPDLVPVSLHSLLARIAEPRGRDAAGWHAEAARLMADPEAGANPDVIDRAVRLLEAVLADTTPEQLDMAARLSNLAGALVVRFEREGTLVDLQRAIVVADDAVAMSAAGRPRAGPAPRPTSAGRCGPRHRRPATGPTSTGRCRCTRRRSRRRRRSHAGRPAYLSSLADDVRARFELGRRAGRPLPGGHHRRGRGRRGPGHRSGPGGRAGPLASVLQTRYDRSGSRPTSTGHPGRQPGRRRATLWLTGARPGGRRWGSRCRPGSTWPGCCPIWTVASW